jgi:hypothetical protein
MYTTQPYVRAEDVTLDDDGLGPPECGGFEDKDGVTVLSVLAPAVNDDAAVVYGGVVCARLDDCFGVGPFHCFLGPVLNFDERSCMSSQVPRRELWR